MLAQSTDVWTAAGAAVLLYLPRITIALVLLAVGWFLAGAIRRLIQRAGHLRKVSSDAMGLLAGAAYAAILATGIVMALGTMGVDVTALVTGLGLTGFAVGFALKDIISNSLSGLLILLYKPFQRGDRVAVVFPPTTFEGQIAHVDLRYTTLTLPDRRVLIPNSILFTNPITVFQEVAATPAPIVSPTMAPSSP